jgi:hypothetical protein
MRELGTRRRPGRVRVRRMARLSCEHQTLAPPASTFRL